MEAVQTRAGEDYGERAEEVIRIGKGQGSLGPTGPILRAVGLGFALGLAVMVVVTLASG